MRLSVIDALCEPGHPDKPNDDAWSAAEGFAAVLDGATGLGARLMDAPSDAAWLAQAGAERLAHHSAALSGRALLRAALAEVEARFLAGRVRAPAAGYELPMASMMTVQAVGDEAVEVLAFGDCGLMVSRPGEAVEVVGEGVARKSDEAAAAAAIAAAMGVSPAGQLHRPEFLADRRAARERYNTVADGTWVFAPDARAADHASAATVRVPPESWMLLATDGFLALTTDYGLYDAGGLLAAARGRGLRPLYAELRAVEDGDAEGRRFPRFKTSDDATAVLIRVGG